MSHRRSDDIAGLRETVAGGGTSPDLDVLLPAVYDELRSLSHAYLRNERSDHTLSATALVNEAYLHLSQSTLPHIESRAHFFRIAALVMRRILINHARGHNARKRGRGQRKLVLEETRIVHPDAPIDLLELDDALNKLAVIGERKARIGELRFFCGCSIEETAEALGISSKTVERDWSFAKSWLRLELSGS